VFWQGGEKSFAKAAKIELARDLVTLIAQHYQQRINTATQPDLPVLSNRK
jgi:hypothetical protein